MNNKPESARKLPIKAEKPIDSIIAEANRQTLSVKIDEKSIGQILEIALKMTKEITNGIIAEMKNGNTERLYNLKQVAELVGVKYRTLQHYELPFRSLGNGARKLYSLNDVSEYLKR